MPSFSSCRRQAIDEAMSPDAPNATYRFTLTHEDALAWELLPREMSSRQMLVYIVVLILAGGALAFLPEQWTEGLLFWVWLVWVALAAYTVSTIMHRSAARARALARFPRPTDVIVEDWDHALTVKTGGRQRHFAFETFLAVTRGKDHMFLPLGGDLVILPHRAVERADREEIAARIILAIRNVDD